LFKDEAKNEGIEAFFNEVNERIKLTNQINSKNELLAHLVDKTSDSVLIFNEKLQLIYANKQIEQYIGRKIEKFPIQRSIDQSYLNLLHKQWVSKISKYPNLGKLCEQQGINYNLVNDSIHQFEIYFKHVRLETTTAYETFVPSKKDIEEALTLDAYQIRVHYDNLGRWTYDQWCVDSEPDSETNNFDIITTRAIDIVLEKFHTITTPPEYISWCHHRGQTALGGILPIGNFRGYCNNIRDLKNIWLRNLEVKQTISILKE
jgi:PAS domain-containing protein